MATRTAEEARSHGPVGPARRSLLRRRDFQLLFSGKLISTCGDMFYVVALPFLVFKVGDGVTTLTAILAAFGLARAVTALPAGALADRVGPRAVMIGADLIRAVAVLGVAVSLGGHHSPVVVLVAAVLLGAGEGCFQPASQSLTPALVSDEELPGANAMIISANLIATAAGPAIGGLGVVAFSPVAMLLIDSGTFLLSAGTLLLIRGSRHAQPESSPDGAPDEARTVWDFIRGSALFRVILLMMAVFGLAIAGTLQVALPLLSKERAALGVTGYGLLMSALGVGWLLGALASRRLSRVTHQGRLVIGLLATDGILLTTLPWVPGEPAMLGIMLALGASDGALLIIVLTVLQRMPPPHLRGRVLGLLAFVTFAMYPISAAFAGAVLSHSAASSFFVFTGSGVFVVALIGVASASIRQVKVISASTDAAISDEKEEVRS